MQVTDNQWCVPTWTHLLQFQVLPKRFVFFSGWCSSKKKTTCFLGFIFGGCPSSVKRSHIKIFWGKWMKLIWWCDSSHSITMIFMCCLLPAKIFFFISAVLLIHRQCGVWEIFPIYANVLSHWKQISNSEVGGITRLHDLVFFSCCLFWYCFEILGKNDMLSKTK